MSDTAVEVVRNALCLRWPDLPCDYRPGTPTNDPELGTAKHPECAVAALTAAIREGRCEPLGMEPAGWQHRERESAMWHQRAEEYDSLQRARWHRLYRIATDDKARTLA